MSAILNQGVWHATAAAAVVIFLLFTSIATFWVALSEEAATAGLLTLSFNHTRSLTFQHSEPSSAFLNHGTLQGIQDGTNSILYAAASKASVADDPVQGAISSAAAALPPIEDHMPLNCSFGMLRFCVRFRHNQFCSGSPFTLTALVPDEIQDLSGVLEDTIQARIQELSTVPSSLGNLSESVIGCLIAGALSMLLLLVLSCCVAFGYPGCVAKTRQKLGIKKHVLFHFGVGIVCCLPYVILVAVQRHAMAAVEKLPVWVEAQAGEIFGISVGILVSGIIFALLVAVFSGWYCLPSNREASESRSWYRLGAITRTEAGRVVDQGRFLF